jgi:hypothetical protein
MCGAEAWSIPAYFRESQLRKYYWTGVKLTICWQMLKLAEVEFSSSAM